MYLFGKFTGVAASIALASAGVSVQASASNAGAAASNPCVGGMQGCVLPVKGAAAVVEEAAAKGGMSILPILLGLGAVAAIIALVGGDDDEDQPFSP